MNCGMTHRVSAKDRLKDWLRHQRYVLTSDIIRWGSNIGYSNRAQRNAQQLRADGFLRRLSAEETRKLYGETGETRELAYEVIGDVPEINIESNGQGSFV